MKYALAVLMLCVASAAMAFSATFYANTVNAYTDAAGVPYTDASSIAYTGYP